MKHNGWYRKYFFVADISTNPQLTFSKDETVTCTGATFTIENIKLAWNDCSGKFKFHRIPTDFIASWNMSQKYLTLLKQAVSPTNILTVLCEKKITKYVTIYR